ncbi:MAG TPA: STAS domain-containing protein [Tepidisphaeraceae bacterium]|nr:STAS domain-containing protein [Tepidisphaeraceae bacterium]
MPIEKWSEQVSIARLGADPALSDDLQALLDPAQHKGGDVVLDMGGVKYINSSHIARLLKLRKRTVNDGSRLVLCAVDPQVWTAFLVTGLDKIFEFTDSVPTALATLQLAQRP